MRKTGWIKQAFAFLISMVLLFANTGAAYAETLKNMGLTLVEQAEQKKSSIDAPFLIYGEANLRELAKLCGEKKTWNADGEMIPYAESSYKMMNDIDISGEERWLPIGGIIKGDSFSGVFDGDGHSISGLTIVEPKRNEEQFTGYGLFGTISNGTVQNLQLTNVDIRGWMYTGAIAGELFAGEIINCASAGSILSENTKNYNCAGGIVGYNRGAVEKCHSSISVMLKSSGSYGTVGGIAGYNSGTIKNSYSTGDVTNLKGRWNYAGGIAGMLFEENSAIEGCYSVGNVTADNYCSKAGGIAGAVFQGIVTNCAAFGSFVSATRTHAKANRIAGVNYGKAENNYGLSAMNVVGDKELGEGGVDISYSEEEGFIPSLNFIFTDTTLWDVSEKGKPPVFIQ